MSKRAIRRHHHERVITRARKIRRRWYNTWEPEQSAWERVSGANHRVHAPQSIDHTIADESARRMADHLKICSCKGGCGNPRRGSTMGENRRTRQELLAELCFREQLSEIDE